MDNDFDTIIGLLMIYACIHFYVIQFKKTWDKRSTYEKILTIASGVFFVLILVGLSQT